CPGIIATITNALAKFVYSGDSYVDFNHKDASGNSDLVKIDNLDMTLDNPALGLRAGNKLTYTAKIVTNIFATKSDPTIHLKNSTFRYLLTTDNEVKPPSVSQGQMVGEWSGGNYNGAATTATSYVSTVPFLLPAGLNRKQSLYLKMGYAVPGYD